MGISRRLGETAVLRLSAAIILWFCGPHCPAADVSAHWDGSNGNWSSNVKWDIAPAYPDNGNDVTYDATISNGNVTLDKDITIQRLFLNGGGIFGSFDLTLKDGLNWAGGSLGFFDSLTVNLAAGSTSTISQRVASLYATLNNSGSFNQADDIFTFRGTINNLAGGTWHLQDGVGMNPPTLVTNVGGQFNNSGDLITTGSTFMNSLVNNSGTVTVEAGTGPDNFFFIGLGGSASGSFNVAAQAQLVFGSRYTLTEGANISGAGLTSARGLEVLGNSTINTSLVNQGQLTVQSGTTLTLGGSFNQTPLRSAFLSDLVTRLDGGTITSVQSLNFQSGTLTGAGTINASANLSANSFLVFQLGGTVAGVGNDHYDHLAISGSIALDGNLALNFKNGFENSINGSDTFVVLNSGSNFVGSFDNVANGSRLDTTNGFGSFVVNYGGSDLSLTNYVPNTRWLGGSGNWTNGTNWLSSPVFPNNSGSTTYSVVIPTGTVNLDTNITVSRFLLTGGNLTGNHSLTINDRFIWTSGSISGSPGSTINLGANSISTIGLPYDGLYPYEPFSASHSLQGVTLNNLGVVTQSTDSPNGIINNFAGATWNVRLTDYESSLGGLSLNNSQFNNSGAFLVTGALDVVGMHGVFNNSGTVTVQPSTPGHMIFYLNDGGTASGSFNLAEQTELSFSGPYNLTNGATINGSGLVYIADTVDVSGNVTIGTDIKVLRTLVVQSGATLMLNGNFTQSGSSTDMTRLNGGTITAALPMTFDGGNLIGTGTINANVNSNGTISPGFSAGTLTINGSLSLVRFSLLNSSKIIMEIGGTVQGTDYDYLAINGALALDGSLQLSLINGFTPSGNQTFTLATANSAITGAFSNVVNGGQLATTQGPSFFVYYGDSSPFGANNLVLSNIQVPEPGSAILLLSGIVVFSVFRSRKR